MPGAAVTLAAAAAAALATSALGTSFWLDLFVLSLPGVWVALPVLTAALAATAALVAPMPVPVAVVAGVIATDAGFSPDEDGVGMARGAAAWRACDIADAPSATGGSDGLRITAT